MYIYGLQFVMIDRQRGGQKEGRVFGKEVACNCKREVREGHLQNNRKLSREDCWLGASEQIKLKVLLLLLLLLSLLLQKGVYICTYLCWSSPEANGSVSA